MEKLQYDERLWLRRQEYCCAKALRIIDDLTAKCDAQAAVIERVRAVCASRPDDDDPEYRVLDDVEAALAAAPEQTAPLGSHAADLQALRATQELLDAANARVAELEAYRTSAEDCMRSLDVDAKTANARADAAERELEISKADADNQQDHRERAESEAATLRAELDAERERTAEERTLRISETADLRAQLQAAKARITQLETTESIEAEELRALLQDDGHDDAVKLAAANALLGRVYRENIRWSGTGTTKLARDIDAYFSGQAPARSASPPPKRL